MSFRNTIIVFVLLALVGGYAYFESRKPEQETVKLFKIKPEDISKIELRYPDREIEAVKEANGKWMIVKPIKTGADQTALSNLAHAIAECEVKKTVEEKPADLTPFGLAKPQVVVTITVKNKALPGVEVGKTTPVGFSAYIKTTDKPAVLLTSSAFPPGMTKKIDDLRDRELMSFNVDDPQKITIERPDEAPIELDKEHDKWTIVKPAKYAADAAQVRQLLSTLANSHVDEFVSDAPNSVGEYGLEKPRLTVAVYTGKAESRQSLLFGGKESGQGKDGIYVRRGERAPVYTVHSWILTDADKTLADLRDKTVFAFDPSAVQSVKLSINSKTFELKRAKDGKWQIMNGETGLADVPAVERLLDEIKDLKAQSIVEDPMKDAAKYGLDSPIEQVTLTSKDGKEIGWLKLGKVEHQAQTEGTGESPTPTPGVKGPPDYYATSSANAAVYKINDFSFDQLSKSPDQLRAKNQPSPSPSAASAAAAASPAAAATATPAK